MYERFTDRARKVMQLANQEAQRFNHEYIGTEHILLGLGQRRKWCCRQRTEESRCRPKKDSTGSGEASPKRTGNGHDGQAATNTAREESHRVLHGRGTQPQPQLRGY